MATPQTYIQPQAAQNPHMQYPLPQYQYFVKNPPHQQEVVKKRQIERADGTRANEEIVSVSHQYSYPSSFLPNPQSIVTIISGKQLENTVGKGTKLNKASMPAFTLFKILSANIADCKDFVQAVYCTLKIVAQYDPEKNETKYHKDYIKDDLVIPMRTRLNFLILKVTKLTL